jgi:HD-like signal output (HDOD) protein
VWALVSGDAIPDEPARSPLGEQVLAHYRTHRPDPASFPALAVRIVDLLERPEVRVDELARWVGMDPAVAGQVLKVANSVIYRRGQDVEELSAAIVRLGLREVGQIAVGVAGRSLFDLEVRAQIETFRERLTGQFLDAMTVAYGASWLAGQLRLGRPERVFLAGMLHDIGFPVALQSLARLIMAGEIRDPLEPLQIDAVLADVHLEVGSDVSAAWCLPPYLLAVCAHHHDPHLPADADHAELHLVRVVSGLQRLRRTGLARGLVETRDSLQTLGLDRPATEGLLRQLEAAQQRVSTLFA